MIQGNHEQVVIGIGNEYRKDDAAGLSVIRRLRKHSPANVNIVEARREGLSFIDAWKEREKVIVVDAAQCQQEAGTIYRFLAHERPLTGVFSQSTHAFSLAQAIELSRTLGELPHQLIVYAIVGADFTMGQGLTCKVETAIDKVVSTILQELQTI